MGRVSCDVTMAQTGKPTPQNPLRVWPGVVAVVLQWLIWLVYPLVARGAIMVAMMGGLAGGLAVLVWWLFFSRAPWAERVGAIVLMVVAVVATKRVVHQSIAGAGMGMMLPIFAVPALSLALVTAAMASRRLSSGPRRVSLVGAIVLACGVFTLLRTGGITGEGDSDSTGGGRRLPSNVSSPKPKPALRKRQSRRRSRPLRQPRRVERRVRIRPILVTSRRLPPPSLPRRAGQIPQERRPELTGPAFVDRSATVSFAACGSKLIGPGRSPSNCGAGRSGRAGRPSRSTAP